MTEAIFPFGPSMRSVIPLGEIQVSSPADALAVRSTMMQGITAGSAPPNMYVLDDHAPSANPQGYFQMTPAFAKWLVFEWPHALPDQSYYGSVNSRVYFGSFYPDATCLLVYNAGHGQGFFSATETGSQPSAPGVRNFLRRAVQELHCDVLLHSLPVQGENAQFIAQLGWTTAPYYAHNAIGDLDPYMVGSPLRFWTEDVSASITYAMSRKSYSKVVCTGISGGGFRTGLMAALDPRITASYAVAGSVPLGLRKLKDWGDWEQFAIANFGVDYPDLHLAGTVDAAGIANRKARVLYNTDDDVAFDRDAYSGFVYQLRAHALQHGFDLRMLSYFGSRHDYSTPMSDFILSDINS